MKKLTATGTVCLALNGVAWAQDEPGLKMDWSGWSVGIGMESYKQPFIERASIYGADRGVVVEKEFKSNPSFWLTTGLKFRLSGLEKSLAIPAVKKIAPGIFVGVKLLDASAQSGASQPLSAFALGPQLVMTTEGGKDIGIGLGWVNHRTQRMAAGIQEGQSLPAMYTDIKYREGRENSWMLMLNMSLDK